MSSQYSNQIQHFQLGEQLTVTRNPVGSLINQRSVVLSRKPNSNAKSGQLHCHGRSAKCLLSIGLVQMLIQNGVYWINAYPHRIIKLSDGNTSFAWPISVHGQLLYHFNVFWTYLNGFTLHCSAANFEAIVPLLNLCTDHGILPENMLNLPNDFQFYLQAFENIWCNTAAQVVLQFCGKLKSDRYPLHK